MNNKNKKKNVTLITTIGITIFLGLIITATYAYWTLTRKQSDTNVVTSSCLDFDLTSVNSGINLASAWPVVDSEGKESTGYTFTVTNHCNNAVDYNVELEETSSSNFPEKYIRFDLDYVENSNTIKDRMDTVGYMDSGTTGRILDSYTLEANSTNTHTLKLWIDEYTPIGYQSKSFQSKINIIGGQGIKAPKIIASETILEDEYPIKYTWYDNGDIFIDILNETLYVEYYIDEIYFTSYLINKYVQVDPDGIFNDAIGTSSKTYLQGDYDQYGMISDYLYFALVDTQDQAYHMAAASKFNGSTNIVDHIRNTTNSTFKDVIYNLITNENEANIFKKLSDHMPRFKNVYINTLTGIPYNFMQYVSANRLSINFVDGATHDHPIFDLAFAGWALNSIDLRSHGYMGYYNQAFLGLYAPNAKLIFPKSEYDISSSYPFLGAIVDTVETMEHVNSGIDSLYFIEDFAYLKKVIVCGSIDLFRDFNFAVNNIDNGQPLTTTSSVDVYFRGPQRTITGFTPGDYKSVTWNYND